jgi:hypothetical protein
MGKLSRTKGANFERKIVRLLRERFPAYALGIRRSQQGDGPRMSDVVGVPGWWIECQCAAPGKYDPHKKLDQAERDAHPAIYGRYAVAITQRSGSSQIWATFSATVGHIRMHDHGTVRVTITFDDWCRLVRLGWKG